MKQWAHSIRWRIFSYYTAVVGAVLALLVAMHIASLYEQEERLAGLRLQAQIMDTMPLIYPPREPGTSRPPPDGVNGRRANHPYESPGLTARFARAEAEGVFILGVHRDGQIRVRSPNVPDDFEIPPIPDQGQRFSHFVTDRYLVAQIHTPRDDRVFFGKSLEQLRSESDPEITRSLMVALFGFVLISSLGYLIIRNGLRPVDEIGLAAQRIAEGDLSGRIDVTAQRSELGRLAQVLNATFGRLREVLQQQIRFTADASHELRTPVASILADCQFSLKKPRSAERYRETIEICHESAQHMRSMIERLGFLAKFDSQEDWIERRTFDLAELARHNLNLVQPLADECGVAIASELRPVTVDADRLRLGQAILNLINNAVRYNREKGEVRVRTGERDGLAFVEIQDTGVGIPPDQLERIFERFYRVDHSRSDRTGGSGLGLAICRAIVESHGGRIAVESEPGRGSCFRITLPKSEHSSPGNTFSGAQHPPGGEAGGH